MVLFNLKHLKMRKTHHSSHRIHFNAAGGNIFMTFYDVSRKKKRKRLYQCSGYYYVWKSGLISFFLVVLFVTCIGCYSHHTNALKNRNMVRFNKDVIKRKDLAKLKRK